METHEFEDLIKYHLTEIERAFADWREMHVTDFDLETAKAIGAVVGSATAALEVTRIYLHTATCGPLCAEHGARRDTNVDA